jgi:hypothetical protein
MPAIGLSWIILGPDIDKTLKTFHDIQVKNLNSFDAFCGDDEKQLKQAAHSK